MSKYDKLREFVRAENKGELTLGFNEIESICGFKIDRSFLNCKKELNAYGYEVAKISLKNKTVSFIRSSDRDCGNNKGKG